MNTDIKELEPSRVWAIFSEICSIPHPSHHEEKIREFVMNFAASHGIEHSQDKAGNIIMRKKAIPGMENRKGIILQAHLDMVPQKNNDKKFDFLSDPIEAYVDGEWVTANGTTLGADNGIGAATILAVFSSDDIPHGPIEALFTASEEVGMDGAFALEAGLLKGDVLINLDSETEGELYVGCAGGLDAGMTFDYKDVPVPSGHKAFRLDVKGLKGGHSGIEIILERGNANKIINRLLLEGMKNHGMLLASIDGGGLRNAIPREAHAIVTVHENEATKFAESTEKLAKTIKNELKEVDEGLVISLAETQMPETVIDKDIQWRLLNAICACPNGIMRMSKSMDGLVQTSLNLARVVSDKGKISLSALLRSSSNSEKEDLGQMVRSVFERAGAKVELTGGYDGWNPNMNSPILASMVKTYEELFGRKPAIMAIHAGLECGILGGTYPSWDMISCGPTISYPHSPDEKVNIASVEKFWKYILASLRNAPVK